MVYIYLAFLLLSPAFVFLFPHRLASFGSAGRELSFLLVLLDGLRRMSFLNIRLSKVHITIMLYLAIVFLYSFKADDFSNIAERLLIYCSGPLMFLSYTIPSKNGDKVIFEYKWTTRIGILFVIINLLLFPLQNVILALSSVNKLVVMRHLSRNSSMRFFGITFMPTIMAFLCLTLMIYAFENRKKASVIPGVGLMLTGTRSFFPGLILGGYLELKKKWKYLLSIFIFVALFYYLIYWINSGDPSLMVHLNSFFVSGPSLVLENVLGCGLGNISAFSEESDIALESDIYLYFIQFGLWGGIVYLIVFLQLYKNLSKNTIKDIGLVKSARLVMICYLTASFVFPLTLQRPISNIFWLYMSFSYSYGRSECLKIP